VYAVFLDGWAIGLIDDRFSRIAKICGSVNLDFFILVSVDNQRRRSPVFKPLIFGDDYR
jgi:hypothetical protein